MLPYQVYKVIHFFGLFMLFVSLGALAFHSMNDGKAKDLPYRRWVLMTHGWGMLASLLGGFGLLAKLGIHGSWPLWVWLKLSIWIVLGGAVAFILRKPSLAKLSWILLIVIGTLAAYIANYKPTF